MVRRAMGGANDEAEYDGKRRSAEVACALWRCAQEVESTTHGHAACGVPVRQTSGSEPGVGCEIAEQRPRERRVVAACEKAAHSMVARGWDYRHFCRSDCGFSLSLFASLRRDSARMTNG
jgi:hypothetical protein